MNLTQKETSLLKDLKEQEQLCVDKYTKHASCAADPQLKNLFTEISQIEQQHLDMITQMESGTVPAPSGSQKEPSFSATYGMAETPEKKADSYLCTDVLSNEKHVSHLYDTCIFEFRDENIRKDLNHIQMQEQSHGKMIYDYMAANGMYS